jgi:beta-hydroxylase
MSAAVLSTKLLLLALFIASAIYVHRRGRIRHRLLRQLTDHSTFFAPLNLPLYLFSKVPATPYHDPRTFPALAVLRENWQTIRDEGLQLLDGGHVRAAASYNDVGFNSFFRSGWKRFYLKWYEDPLPSAEALCPQTVALLKRVPTVHAAMFTLLPPGSKLGAHRDPYAGSLRYHLGLYTPNSADCYIAVDGERYHWRDGEDIIFDETYIHTAENKTDQTRLILFCDVERPVHTRLVRAYNHFMCSRMMKAAATQNVEGERVGAVNKIFGYVYHVRLLGKRLKAWNRKVYYLVKYALFGGLVYLVFF